MIEIEYLLESILFSFEALLFILFFIQAIYIKISKKKFLNSGGISYIFSTMYFTLFIMSWQVSVAFIVSKEVFDILKLIKIFSFISGLVLMCIHFMKTAKYPQMSGQTSTMKVLSQKNKIKNITYITAASLVGIQSIYVSIISNSHFYQPEDYLLVIPLFLFVIYNIIFISIVNNKKYYINWLLFFTAALALFINRIIMNVFYMDFFIKLIFVIIGVTLNICKLLMLIKILLNKDEEYYD